MGDGFPKIEFLPDYFEPSRPTGYCIENDNSSNSQPRTENSLRSWGHLWSQRKLIHATAMLNLFGRSGLPWGSGSSDKVELTTAEVESLRSEIADLEEREAHLKARLENLDELLRSARLTGYLFLRTRWTALPGEPPIIDSDIDDWLPRFVVLHGACIFFYLLSTDLSPQDSTLLSDIVEVGPLSSFIQEDEQTRYSFYILTCHGLRYECSSLSEIQVNSWLKALRTDCKLGMDDTEAVNDSSKSYTDSLERSLIITENLDFKLIRIAVAETPCERAEFVDRMSSQIYKSSASKVLRAFISASKSSPVLAEGRAVAAATATLFRGKLPFASFYGRENSHNASRGWVSGALALPAAVYMLQEQEAHAAEMERTFIAIKPDGVQRGLIAEILSRFERKGFKLVAVKLVVPSKEFAQKHYHDLKERPFFNGLCDFLSSGPVLAMVWEGEGVIKYGRKLIGATDPQKSEPGTIRGDLAVVVGRNIIHGSDGPETAKDEINLWFKPEELVSYTSNEEKWVYGNN
ncbi:uncharacterized protein LOC122655918 [Telopea speciosissima]|uniref:uncharacterized protein LOC122655918 n=1 Tax=Telopea speciosissima TaxID=54955 RepID=UPI001CC5C34E|nr:uncharacterized protein LOC122655918 [Telopea speciosissima]